MFEGLTYNQLKRAMSRELDAAGKPDGLSEARDMILEFGNLTPSDLIIQGEDYVPQNVAETLRAVMLRRLSGEPLDHILGYRDFGGRRFKSTKDVLSPREDTWILIEQALAARPSSDPIRVLDLGTGTGAIIISLLLERPNWTGVGVDLSESALAIAAHNVTAYNLNDRLTLRQSDWFETVDGKFDLIVSNPPYIAKSVLDDLEDEVRFYDPSMALDGGEDGLEAYRHILNGMNAFLEPGGYVCFEIGFDQGEQVSSLMKKAGLSNIEIFKDLSGHDRVVTATK